MRRKIGNSIVTQGSVENGQVESLFSDGRKADILYSDPPWGDGNTKYWNTMNKKMTGQEAPVLTFAQLIDRVISLATAHVHGLVVIETGLRWGKEVEDKMAAAGITHISAKTISYRSGSRILPNLMIFGSTDGKKRVYSPPTKTMGVALVKDCISKFKTEGGVVFDPCCGMGYSAKAALANGMSFRGNELNAKRLQKTIDFLTKSS